MKAFCYARYGREEQLGGQTNVLRKHAQTTGRPIHIFTDTCSGLRPPLGRPGWISLLALVARGDQLLVTDLTKISRSPVGLFQALSYLLCEGVEVVVVDDEQEG